MPTWREKNLNIEINKTTSFKSGLDKQNGNKRLFVLVAIFMLVVSGWVVTVLAVGNPQSSAAWENANCHASFLRNCADSSSVRAVPAPLLGSGLVGLVTFAGIFVYGLLRRNNKSAQLDPNCLEKNAADKDSSGT